MLIDLGVPADEPDRPGERSRPSRGVLAVALVLLLAFTVAGSAPVRAPGWQAGQLPISAGDDFALTGDLLLVAGESTVTAYRVPALDPVWSRAVPAAVGHSLAGLGELLLIGGRNGVGRELESTAVSATTGEVRWRHAGRIIPLPDSDVLLAVTDVPSVSASNRRLTGTIEGIDRRGDRRWSIRLPSSAVAVPLPGARFLLVHDDGTAEVRGASDAAVRAAGRLPPAAYAPDNPRVIGGTVVLRHPGDRTSAVSGYGLNTLEPRWSRTDGGLESVDRCGVLVCLGTMSGVRALDPSDGSTVWFGQSWRRALTWGDVTLADGHPAGVEAPLALVDPATGESLLDLGAWRQVTSVTDDVVLAHSGAARGDTLVATVAADQRSVRVLGTVPAASGGCRAGGGVLACRQGGGILGVWALD